MKKTELYKKISNIVKTFGNKVSIHPLGDAEYYVYIKSECMSDYLAVEKALEKDDTLKLIGDSFMWYIYIGNK